MANLARNPDLRVGELSELVILFVLDALGRAGIPVILESLAKATADAKAPFSVGPSLENVLKWQEASKFVQANRSGNSKMYQITAEGKEAVHEYDNLLRALFPNITTVRGEETDAIR